MKQDAWKTAHDTPHLLLRTNMCDSANDPKFFSELPLVYIPVVDFARAQEQLSNPAQLRVFDPSNGIPVFYNAAAQHGLIYLPYPYLVPGGRFNEMYGWDTAFAVFAWAETHPKIRKIRRRGRHTQHPRRPWLP